MKALTVRQPWASLIVAGVKDVENRTWQTKYRGPLLIHSASKPGAESEYGRAQDILDAITVPGHLDGMNKAFLAITRDYRQLGVVLGVVNLVNIWQNDACSPWAEPGQRHWVLQGARQFEATPRALGKLGVWEYDEATE